MELSDVQKDALDELASLGCNIVFIQYDQCFQSYSYFHLASLYPSLLQSNTSIHVEETVFALGITTAGSSNSTLHR